MRSNRPRVAVAVSLGLALLVAGPVASRASVPGLADADAAKAADKCQKQIGKAGEKFIKNKLKKLDKCLAGIFKCIQTKEGQKQTDCVAKAATKCDKELAKIFDKDEPKLKSDIAKKCGSAADMLATDGLGFSGVASYCQSEHGVTLTTVADIAECIRRDKECAAERLFRVEFPRASELLDTAGVNGALAANFTCLMGSMGAGGGFGNSDPKGAGKAIDKCAKETKKAGAKFASSKIKSIEKCLGEIFKCVQTKPGDQGCLDKAAGKCAKEFGAGGKIAKAADKLKSSLAKKCGPANFAELAGTDGMNLDDVASVCTQFGVAGLSSVTDYAECLYRQHECFVDDLITVQYPRAEELLGDVGLADEIPAVFCGPTPTPTVTVTPTPTITPTPTLSATPTTMPTPTQVPGGSCNDGVWNVGEACDPNAPPPNDICPNAGNGLQTCNVDCTCDCPSVVTFVVDPNDPATSLDTGFQGFAHNTRVIGDGTVTVTLSNCSDGVAGKRDPTCGVCDVGGPIENLQANAGENPTKRCKVDSSITCTVDSDCPASQTCSTYFGSFLPLSAGGTSSCVINRFSGAIVGTADIETGASANQVSITSEVHLGPSADKPCNNCIGDTIANDGVRGGTCDAGSRSGQTCDVMGRSPIPAFNGGVPAGGKVNGTSLDCPYAAGTDVGVLPIDLTNSTGSETLTVKATGPTCTASGFGLSTCICDTCATAAAEPCNADSDCPASVACGGLRCLGGANAGTACTTPGLGDAACAGAPCGNLGEPTKPNACNGSCDDLGGGKGACDFNGPFGGACQPVESFRGCNVNGDCPFAGDTCVFAARPCFLDGGVVGNAIEGNGMADLPVNDTSRPLLASVFCIAPTTSGAINGAAGLPGAGRVILTGDANGLP